MIKTFGAWLNENLLLEKSIDTIQNLTDIVNKKEYLKDVKNHDGFEDTYFDEYKRENDIEEDWDDFDSNDEEFNEWLWDELESKFYDVQSNLYSQIKNGKITIYRAIHVIEDWVTYLEKQGKHLGIYWTYDKDSVDTYWSDDKRGQTKDVIIETNIPEQYVDWNETYLLNMDLSLGDMEKEIRLFKNTPLKIEKMWGEENKKIDISSIKDKTFYA